MTLSRTRKTPAKTGSGPAAQANSAGIADVLQPVSATTSSCVTQPSLTGCCCTSSHAALPGRSRVAEAGPSGLNPVTQDSQRTSTQSSKDKGLAIPLPTVAAPKVPARGRQIAMSSTCIAQSDAVIHKSPSQRSHTECAAESNDVLKNKDRHKNNVPENKDHLKKSMASSSKQEHCITECEGSGSAAQADPSGSTNVVKPASVTTSCRFTRSSLASSSCTTAHAALASSSHVANAGSADRNPVARDSPWISTWSSKDEGLGIPPPTTVAQKVLAQDSQKISPSTSKDKGLAVSPPTSVAPKGHAQGKQSAVSTTGNAQSDAEVIKLPSKKGESNDVPKNKDNCKKDVLKNDNKKYMPSSSEQELSVHIKCEDLFSNPSLEPLGERCQLCGIDLAFTPKGPSSRSGDPPSSAVLPCRHSYHDSCLEDVFGPVEPPCIRCLDVEAPNGC